jgi:hypothetical protein
MTKASFSTKRSMTNDPPEGLVIDKEHRMGKVFSASSPSPSEGVKSDVSGGLSRSSIEKVSLSLRTKREDVFREIYILLSSRRLTFRYQSFG